MRVPYRPATGRNPSILYPLIRVAIGKRHAQRSRFFEAMVDSGSADCMFHASIAQSIGIRLDTGRREVRTGISGATSDVWVHPVLLYVGADMFQIEASFSRNLPLAGLLERNGFFEYFKITSDPSTDPPELDIERVIRT